MPPKLYRLLPSTTAVSIEGVPQLPATTAALIRENTHTKASELDNSRMYTSFQTLHRALCSTVLRFPRAYNCVGKPARRIVANPDMWSSKDRNDRIPFNASRLLR